MGKSNWRLKYISKSVMSKVFKESIGAKLKKKFFIIANKSSTIPNSLVKLTFYIHKGIGYRELKITDRYVGFKFGEFILTRKPYVYPRKIKKNK